MSRMVPLSGTAYLESHKEDIRIKLCFERISIPKIHQWLCHGQEYWVGEGTLRWAINKWTKAEPAQWNIPSLSLPARPSPRLLSQASRAQHNSTPNLGPYGTVTPGQYQLRTSTLGTGQGSMASAYVQTGNTFEQTNQLDPFLGAAVRVCEVCGEEGVHPDCDRYA